MSSITLDLFKKHVALDDYDGDDALLEHYLLTAEEVVIGMTRRTREELCWDNGGTLPVSLRQAVMLVAANFYRHRENVEDRQHYAIPYGVEALVKPFVKLSRP